MITATPTINAKRDGWLGNRVPSDWTVNSDRSMQVIITEFGTTVLAELSTVEQSSAASRSFSGAERGKTMVDRHALIVGTNENLFSASKLSTEEDTSERTVKTLHTTHTFKREVN